ncbi:MAG: hypothetical protein GX220_08590 [Treponema sp.]|nr:hypothetical protein [Treponema sp.]
MANEELLSILDYILNRCPSDALNAIDSAVKRRRADLSGTSINPEKFAKTISKTVNESIAVGIKSMQNSIKNMAYNLIKKDSPDLNEEEIDKIVQMMVPNVFEKKPSVAAEFLERGESLLDNEGRVNGFPVDAMREMVVAFVNYSFGTLRPDEDRALQNALGDWQAAYWKAFPEPLQDLIRIYLKNGLPDAAFTQAVDTLLPDPDIQNESENQNET